MIDATVYGSNRHITFRRFLSSLLLALSGAASLCAQSPVASSGRDFYLALPSLVLASPHTIRVNIVATKPATVTVTLTESGATQTKTLATNERWEVAYSRDQAMLDQREYLSERTIHVESTEPVTVNLTSDANYVTDAYAALPTPALGFDYVAMAHPSANDPNAFAGFVAVIATQDGTEIRITPSVNTSSGASAGFTYGVPMKKGEVYQILPASERSSDLTGTRIQSNKPVAVISGHRNTVLKEGVGGATNALIEQMIPTADWGKKFYALPLAGQPRGYYRAYSSRNGTEVRVNGTRIVTLGAGGSHDFAVEGAVTIDASAPIMLVQYATYIDVAKGLPTGDPSMMTVNPIDSYNESFIWGVSPLSSRTSFRDPESQPVPFEHYVMIIAPSIERTSVRLDGVPISFTIPFADGAYYGAIVKVLSGAHSITSPVPVNAQLFGYSEYDAYAMPAGVRLRDPFRAEPLFARTCQSFIDTTISVLNVGADPIEVRKIEFASGLTGTVISPSFFPFNVPSASTARIRVRIDLTGYGLRSGSLVITTASSGSRPLEVPIEIWRDSLAIRSSQSELRFPPVPSTSPSYDSTITIVNSGSGPTTISALTFTGPFSLVSPTPPVTIGAGDSVRFVVRFTPPAGGSYTGSVTVSQTPCGASTTVQLMGERARPAAVEGRVVSGMSLLCPDPTFVDVPLTIYNRGGEPLVVDSVQVAGADADDFAVVLGPRGVSVAAGDSLVVTVRFLPRRTGERQATLRVWNSASPADYLLLPISARKDSVGLTSSESAIDFGLVTGCSSASPRTITLRNSGTVPLSIDSTRIGMDFEVGGDPSGTLAPGASREVTVRFSPIGSGKRNDTLWLIASPCGTRVPIALQGEQQGAGLATSVEEIDFGVVPFCELPRNMSMTIRNSGFLVDSNITVSIEGNGFAFDPISTTTLAPGETLPLNVRLALAPAGDYSATLVVRAEPCGLERRVALRAAVRAPSATTPATISLGALSSTTPTRGSTMLRNDGALGIVVRDIGFAPAIPGLRLLTSLPATLAPGEELIVEVEYSSSAPAAFTTTATVAIDSPCVASRSFTVEATNEEAAITLLLPDTSANVDARVMLPVRVRSSRAIPNGVTIEGTVAWRWTMLAPGDPLAPIPGSAASSQSSTRVDAERHYTFRYDGALPAADTLLLIPVDVLLGDAETTTLRWIDASATSSLPGFRATVTTRDGAFRTLGICLVDGARLVRVTDQFGVGRIVPTPMDDAVTIEIDIPESAHTTLRIYDAVGRHVATVVDEELSAGPHDIPFDASTIASGVYVYELRSGAKVMRGKMVK